MPNKRFADLEVLSPKDIVYDDQSNLALIASDVDAIEGPVRLVRALGSVFHLNRWDRAAGLTGVVSGSHGSGQRVEMTRDNQQPSKKHLVSSEFGCCRLAGRIAVGVDFFFFFRTSDHGHVEYLCTSGW